MINRTAFQAVPLALAIAAFSLLARPVMAQDAPAAAVEEFKTVTVEGSGAGADLELQKAAALRDALRKAVEAGAGTYIHSQSEAQNFQLMQDTILAQSAGFVKSYKILKETAGDDAYTLKIEAVVSVKAIVDKWGAVKIMLQQMGRPKIMVYITEKLENPREQKTEVVDVSTVQTAVERLLMKDGFLLINRDQVKELLKTEKEVAAAEDKPEKLLALAKQQKAQLLITGAAHSTLGDRSVGGDDLSLETCSAECNLSCLNADNAMLLSSVPGKTTRGVGRTWREAAKKALDFEAQIVAPMIVDDVLKFWSETQSGRGEMELQVENIKLKDALKIKDALKKIHEIKDVSYVFNNKIATYSIQAEVGAQPLAEIITKTLGDLLDITDVSANTIKATFSAGKE